MRAARLHGIGDLRVEDIPTPGEPAEGWVRCRVTAAGICGSDLHNFRTGQWISRSPSVPGHELAGIVTAIGAGVSGLAEGDAVVADSRFFCGACPACIAGRHNLCATLGFVGEVCDGGFAEEVVLPARLLHKVDPGLDPAIAATAEPLAVALHAVHRLGCGPGDPVLIAGCGPIGGLVALLLRDMGAGRILIADRNHHRLASVADAAAAEPVSLDGDASALPPVRHAVEATGSVHLLPNLIDRVDAGARIALVGIFHGRLDLDPNLIVERELSLEGCSVFADELPEAIAMLPRLAPAIRRMIDTEIAIEDLPEAYRRLLAGEAKGLKTIVRPHLPRAGGDA
jgi:(R,R)-butanediol dehydrogenase/meso-butanediol dehydrogenase/diacetyl reductase